MPKSKPETQTITCIGCPNGCQIEVTQLEEGFKVEGNECKKGEEYAIQEFTAPKRILTTTLQVSDGVLPLIPVRSDAPIPKASIFNCMKLLADVEVSAPIKVGQKLVQNILNLGVDIVASRNLDRL